MKAITDIALKHVINPFATSYYFSTTLQNAGFDEAITKVTEELKKEGFGVLTEIDIQGTLKQKLDVDFKKYRILGAGRPQGTFGRRQDWGFSSL